MEQQRDAAVTNLERVVSVAATAPL